MGAPHRTDRRAVLRMRAVHRQAPICRLMQASIDCLRLIEPDDHEPRTDRLGSDAPFRGNGTASQDPRSADEARPGIDGAQPDTDAMLGAPTVRSR
jgi:hypothetical protein